MTTAQSLFVLAGVLAGWVYAHFQIVALFLRKGRSKSLGHCVGALFSWIGALAGFMLFGSLYGMQEGDPAGLRVTLFCLGLLVLSPFVYVSRIARAKHADRTTPVAPQRAPVRAEIAESWAALRSSLQQCARAVRELTRSRPAAKAEKAVKAKAVQPPKQPAITAPLLPANLFFDYIDRDGVITSRSVLSCRIETSGSHHYLTGYCEERKAERTFRFDRISGRLRVKGSGHHFSAQELLARNPTSASLVFDRSHFRNH